MNSFRSAARRLLAAAAPLALVSAMTTGAYADPASQVRIGSVEQRQAGAPIQGFVPGSAPRVASTVLFPVDTNVDGTIDLWSYCIEYTVNAATDADGAAGAWHTFPGDNKFKTSKDVREKVHWIINNSYPRVPVADVAKAVPALTGLTEREAITATQAAIWHFSDDLVVTDFAAGAPTGHDVDPRRVAALFQHLTGPANTGVAEHTDQISVSLSPSNVEGKPGTLVGPVVVKTDGEKVSVASTSEHPLVTADGSAVDTNAVKDGDALYLNVPASANTGSTEISATSEDTSPVGRIVVVPLPNGQHAQTIILASTGTHHAQAKAAIQWTAPETAKPTPKPTRTPAPEPSTVSPEPTTPVPTPTKAPKAPKAPKASAPDRLPTTGADIIPFVAVASIALLGGGAVLIARRLRKIR